MGKIEKRILILDWHRILVHDPFLSLLSGAAFFPGECPDCLDGGQLEAFLKGELIEWEFLDSLYRKNHSEENLPHPRKLKKRILSRLRMDPGNVARLEELKKEGFLLGLAANSSVWYRSFTAPIEPKIDFFFISCEMGVLLPEVAFFQTMAGALEGESAVALFYTSSNLKHREIAGSSGFTPVAPEETGFQILQ